MKKHTIKLVIPDQIFKEVRDAIEMKIMVGGAYGILDSFISKLVAMIEDGEEVWEVKYKSRR